MRRDIRPKVSARRKREGSYTCIRMMIDDGIYSLQDIFCCRYTLLGGIPSNCGRSVNHIDSAKTGNDVHLSWETFRHAQYGARALIMTLGDTPDTHGSYPYKRIICKNFFCNGEIFVCLWIGPPFDDDLCSSWSLSTFKKCHFCFLFRHKLFPLNILLLQFF